MGRPPAVRQTVFTVITKIAPARVAELRAYLNRVDAALMQQSALPFGQIDMLHFCSFTIFEDNNDGEAHRFGPYLVFESNIDGREREYIETISNVAGPALHDIYRCCLDYASNGAVQTAYLRQYLCAHIIRPGATFIGNVGRSARRVRDEAALVAAIEGFLDGSALAQGQGVLPEAVFALVHDFVKRDDRWNWVWRLPPRLSGSDRCQRWAPVFLIAGIVLAELPLTIVAMGVFLAVLRRHEKTDPIHIPGPKLEQVQALAAREDQIVQNHMASLCYVKAGRFRRATLKLVLVLANVIARISIAGKLSGLDSLHFAQWALIDDDSRLLFLTNYDGSWENYLDDFIDKAALGLTGIWSNTLNFPATSWLVRGGARDERKFKAIARTTQAYTNVWYSAYPELTVTAIQNNTAICAGLAQPTSAKIAAAWLRRL